MFLVNHVRRRAGLAVKALNSGSKLPGSNWDESELLCCVLGQKTLFSQCLSLPRIWMGTGLLSGKADEMYGGNHAMDQNPM